MSDLPQSIVELVDVLAAMPGAVAVVLGARMRSGPTLREVIGISASTIAARLS
jgi:hypothetical protein